MLSSKSRRRRRDYVRKLPKSESDKLREQIEYAKSVVPTCFASAGERDNVSSILGRAERELRIEENFSGSKILYDSVKGNVTRCEPDLSPDLSEFPESEPSFLFLIILSTFFVFITGLFGFLWYRTAKRQSQESKYK